MTTAKLDGVELEYEVHGSGEPMLLIATGPISRSFLPFSREPALTGQYRLISYRQRGQSGSSRGEPPVSFAQHAADAAALLGDLGVARAHVAGHSSGGDIALQLALDHPELVHTLTLLEPALMRVPSAAAFLARVGPAVAAHAAGKRDQAMAEFLSVVSGLDWATCQAVIERQVPGGVGQAIQDADTFFGSYLPALGAWQFGAVEAAAISQPVLSVLGAATERLFTEGHKQMRSWIPWAAELIVEDVGHLLHVQRPEPVARAVAEFLARHPMKVAEPGPGRPRLTPA